MAWTVIEYYDMIDLSSRYEVSMSSINRKRLVSVDTKGKQGVWLD